MAADLLKQREACQNVLENLLSEKVAAADTQKSEQHNLQQKIEKGRTKVHGLETDLQRLFEAVSNTSHDKKV